MTFNPANVDTDDVQKKREVIFDELMSLKIKLASLKLNLILRQEKLHLNFEFSLQRIEFDRRCEFPGFENFQVRLIYLNQQIIFCRSQVTWNETDDKTDSN